MLRLGDGLFHCLGSNASDVESTHRELCARFTDRLGTYDADGQALLHHTSRGAVHAVALGANTQRAIAGQGRAHPHFLVAHRLDLFGDGLTDHLILIHDQLIGDDVDDLVAGNATSEALRERNLDLVALVNNALGNAIQRPTIVFGNDHVLGNIRELPREVARVRCLERSICKPLARPVRGRKVLQHLEALAKASLDGRFYDVPRGFRHQATHPSQLTNLGHAPPRTRVHHHEDRVEVLLPVTNVILECREHIVADALGRVSPQVNNLVVAFTLGDDSALVLFLNLIDLDLCRGKNFGLGRRNPEILLGEGKPGKSSSLEAQILQVVEQGKGRTPSQELVTIVNDAAKVALGHLEVIEIHSRRENVVEVDTPHCGYIDPVFFLDEVILCHEVDIFRKAHSHRRVVGDLSGSMGAKDLHGRRERSQRLPLLRLNNSGCQVVATENDVLRRRNNRLSARRRKNIVRRHHESLCFHLRFDGQWQMHGHLIAVEVSIEALANERVDLDRIALDEDRLEGLNSHAVQGRSAIQENRMLTDNILEDIPDLIVLPLEHLLCALDRIGMAQLFEPPDNKGLEELQRDFLGKTALMNFQLRPHSDHRAGAVINTLPEEVLPEAPLLPLDHVRQ